MSVIIPARDAAPTLERTLVALERQEFGEEFEIIVIDDGSRDETPAIARRYGRLVTLVESKVSGGPGAARNLGAAAARAPVLAFTDADCFPIPTWLEHGCAALANYDLVQGRVDPDPTVKRTPFDRSLSVSSHGGFYQTANLFVTREVFDSVGGFRDWALEQPGRRRWSEDRRRGRAARTPIGEDTVFAWSARRRGARSTYAPEAVVHHAVVPGTLRDALADRWHWTRDMPGLVKLVPELRRAVFYKRVFFGDWTAKFDLAVAGLIAAGFTRRAAPLAAVVPYARRVARDAGAYDFGADPPLRELASATTYALGTAAIDAATLAGFLVGSVEWQALVL